jgi:hypothetical protein
LRRYFTALFPIFWRSGDEREETGGKDDVELAAVKDEQRGAYANDGAKLDDGEDEGGKEWELVVFYDSSFHFVREIPWDVRMQSHHYAPLSRNRNYF